MTEDRSKETAGRAADREPGTLLEVRDLTVRFEDGDGTAVTVLEGATFELAAGEVLGVLGESGGGKTTLALALLGLLPPAGRVTRGRVTFEGRDLLRLTERQLEGVRGDRISMVFQEPGLSLSPCLAAGEQVADVVRVHRAWSRRRCREAALAMLEQVGFRDPARVYRAYPHELSGGQRQRVVIAQALVCRPALVVADEPTAALDATTQAEIVALLERLKEQLELAVVFVSHDAALLAALADRLIVVYAGQIVETGSRDRIYAQPSHPYTRELLRCAPALAPGSPGGVLRLPQIPGEAPDPARWPPGCRFEPRCGDRMEVCARRRPEPYRLGGGAQSRCFLHEA